MVFDVTLTVLYSGLSSLKKYAVTCNSVNCIRMIGNICAFIEIKQLFIDIYFVFSMV